MSVVAVPPRTDWDGRGVTVEEVAQQLARQRRPADGGTPFMLSGVLNLVAYAGHPSETAAMLEVIERLADHQPSRAVVLCGEPDGDGIDARISTSCRISGGTATALTAASRRGRPGRGARRRRRAPTCRPRSSGSRPGGRSTRG